MTSSRSEDLSVLRIKTKETLLFFNSEFLSLSHSKTKGADKGTDLICVSLYDYHDGHQHLHAVVCLSSVATLDKSIPDKNLQLLYKIQKMLRAKRR